MVEGMRFVLLAVSAIAVGAAVELFALAAIDFFLSHPGSS
jgi:hypothetical protein